MPAEAPVIKHVLLFIMPSLILLGYFFILPIYRLLMLITFDAN